MIDIKNVIIGCGDVGRRIALQLIESNEARDSILGLVQTANSLNACGALGIECMLFDLDEVLDGQGDHAQLLNQVRCYYLVPPQKIGFEDERSRALLTWFTENKIQPSKVVLVSTTGVYGDCDGEWVSEKTPTNPQTERGKRRLSSERQWTNFSEAESIPITILRVPGIYAHSRIPVKRIEQGIPVVTANECGFTNRIHADDLAAIAIKAMQDNVNLGIFNATDGTPGKISEYLQTVAEVLGKPPLPEISMMQAQGQLSSGMLSYLGESRRISNTRILKELKVTLRYPDFRQGLKSG